MPWTPYSTAKTAVAVIQVASKSLFNKTIDQYRIYYIAWYNFISMITLFLYIFAYYVFSKVEYTTQVTSVKENEEFQTILQNIRKNPERTDFCAYVKIIYFTIYAHDLY